MTDCPKPMDRESEKRYTDTRNRGEGRLTEVEFKLEPGRQEPKIVILIHEVRENMCLEIKTQLRFGYG